MTDQNEKRISSPDVSEIELSELKVRNFPSEITLRISISGRAHRDVKAHAKEDTHIELCGVLVGEVFQDERGPYIEISGVIRGEKAENQGSQVTFTHETWSHINKVKDSEYPKKRIVGWYHTHPRFGIFLSTQDLFIHENFFNQPWQIAFVVDPISGDNGFFVWQDGHPARIDHYWVDGRQIRSSGEDVGREEEIIERLDRLLKTTVRPSWIRLIPLYLLVLGLATVGFLLFASMDRATDNLKHVVAAQNERLETIAHQRDPSPSRSEATIESANIQEAVASVRTVADLDIRIRKEGGHIWCYGKVSSWYQKETLARVIGSIDGVESVDLRGIVVTHRYTTQSNDNLSMIAWKIYGNSFFWKKIYKANEDIIRDPGIIQPDIPLSIP